MADETAAQIAAKLCLEMADLQQPNQGDYIAGIPGPYGPVGHIANADLVVLSYPMMSVDFGSQPSWTALNPTATNTTGVPFPVATGASILMIEYLVFCGQMTLDQVMQAIDANPALCLQDLYQSGGNLQQDALHAALANGAPTNNDPYGIFEVKWV